MTVPSDALPGNVMIASNDFGSWNDALWSWHIWITDYEPDQNAATGQAMDRNLGATSTSGSESFGLHYQWGRKDPMYGSYNYEEPYISSRALPYGYPLAMSSSTLQAIMTFTTSQQYQSWVTASPWTFIGYDGSWRFDSTADDKDWRDDIKTDQDPCPTGWRVPSLQVAQSFNWPSVYHRRTTDGYLERYYPIRYHWTSSCASETHAASYRGDLQTRATGCAVRCVKE